MFHKSFENFVGNILDLCAENGIPITLVPMLLILIGVIIVIRRYKKDEKDNYTTIRIYLGIFMAIIIFVVFILEILGVVSYNK